MNDNKMWALVKESAAPGLALKRVEIPEVGTNDVKIKIHKTAICGTDVHIYQWNEWGSAHHRCWSDRWSRIRW